MAARGARVHATRKSASTSFPALSGAPAAYVYAVVEVGDQVERFCVSSISAAAALLVDDFCIVIGKQERHVPLAEL
jgi:hypothetical protein